MIDAVPPEKRLDFLDQQLNQRCQVRLKTCADVYNYWRTCKRLYKKAPKDGVQFEIDYIDTGLALSEDIRSKAPVALALHGAPGSYHDFALLIHHLTQQNVRVIAPNFPEYTATVRTKVLFRHSADEKAAYLRDFLKAINVTTIDLLVSHSSAIFPTLLILLNANEKAIAKRRGDTKLDDCNNGTGNKDDDCNDGLSLKEDRVREIESIKRNGVHLVARKDSADIANKCLDDIGVEEKLGSEIEKENSGAKFEDSNGDVYGDDESATEELASSDSDEAPFEDDATVSVVSNKTDKNNNYNCNGDSDQDVTSDGAEEQLKRANQSNNCDYSANKFNNNGNSVTIDSNGKIVTTEDNESTQADKKKSHRKRIKSRRNNQDVIVEFDQPIEIKAVALFNPAGHRLPKSMKPTWFKCGAVHVYQHKLGRSLFRKLGPAFLTIIGVPVRVDNMDNVMLSATVMRNSKCQRVVQQLEQLSQMKVPTLLVFSENDKLIEKEIFYEMTQFMKLDPQNFDIFNNDGDIELSQSLRDDWIRVMVFKAGGHYAYSNYARTVNKAVSELLRRVVPDSS